MMRKIVFILLALLIAQSCAEVAFAYWIWTPETGKFINPKHAVKETPEKQFDWAKSLFESGKYNRAIDEFEKLIKHYPFSKLSSEAQFYVGSCYENLGQYHKAFENYQLVIDKYPYTEKVEEIIEREYRIANLFYSGQKAKMLGMSLLPAKDKAI